MNKPPDPTSPLGAPSSRSESEQRSSVARNVLANWFWYAFVVLSGFLLPRLIDRHQGREILGVWDVSWSLVVYVGFLGMSVGSAVSRYVARFRAMQDWDRLNTTVNTSLAILSFSAIVGAVFACLLAWLVPVFLPGGSPDTIAIARQVVLLLAIHSALQLPGSVFNGVITGYERYDRLNVIRVLRDGAALIVCVVLLLMGNGIVAIAAALLLFEVCGDVAKWIIARRLCPRLRVSFRWVTWTHAKELLAFGGKSAAQSIARGGIYQISSLLVAAFLGPATLAVYSRQRALVMHAMRFVKQYAQVFAPRSSVLDAQGDLTELRATFIRTSKYGFYIFFPIAAVYLIMGSALLELWMGEQYIAPWVLTVLSIGHLMFVPQLGVYSILLGMGLHGVPGWIEVGAAVFSLVLGLVFLGPLNGGMVGAALAMTIPLTISGGMLMPAYACKKLGVSLRHYTMSVLWGPLLAVVPVAVGMLLVRILLTDNAIEQILICGATGAATLAAVYWTWVLPPSWKNRIRRYFKKNHATSA